MSRGTTVSAEVDEVEREDGIKIQPVSVVFPNGNIIPPKQLDEVQPWEPVYKALAPTFILLFFLKQHSSSNLLQTNLKKVAL